jgi:hypothetical protein
MKGLRRCAIDRRGPASLNLAWQGDPMWKKTGWQRKCFFLIVLAWIWTGLGVSVAAERFTDNGDGTVTDNELKLMWAKQDNNGDIDWIQAQKWVTYTFPMTIQKQYDNWRLPTLKELQSLVIAERGQRGYETDCGQWVKIVPAIRLSCGWLWTSETSAIGPTARIFNFDNNYHYTVRKSQKRAYRALAVRALE